MTDASTPLLRVSPLSRSVSASRAPTDEGALSEEGGVEVAPLPDGATAGRDIDRASGTTPPSPPADRALTDEGAR